MARLVRIERGPVWKPYWRVVTYGGRGRYILHMTTRQANLKDAIRKWREAMTWVLGD